MVAGTCYIKFADIALKALFMLRIFRIPAAIAVLCALAAPASGAETVNCYDRDRDLVTERQAGECRGETIDDARAKRIRDARIERIRRQLQGGKSVFPGRRRTGSGSSFFVSAEGHLLTNDHVIARCDAVSVKPVTGDAVAARIVAREPSNDLALIQVEKTGFPIAVFRTGRRIGGSVRVAGYPSHGRVAIQPLLTHGRILTTDDSNPRRFRIRAAIRRGNSGGPVLDRAGLVIGVITAKIDTPKVYERTGRIVRDIGIVVDRHIVRQFLDRNRIDYRHGAGNKSLSEDALSNLARSIVARVICWN